MDKDDLIIYKEDDSIMSLGYKIDSLLIKDNLIGGGGKNNKLNEILSLTIPSDLACISNTITEYKNQEDGEPHSELSDKIHDELLNLITNIKTKKSKTRKESKMKNKNKIKLTKRIKRN